VYDWLPQQYLSDLWRQFVSICDLLENGNRQETETQFCTAVQQTTRIPRQCQSTFYWRGLWRDWVTCIVFLAELFLMVKVKWFYMNWYRAYWCSGSALNRILGVLGSNRHRYTRHPEFFRGFPQSIEENPGIGTSFYYNHFLPNPFQFINDRLRYCQRRETNHKKALMLSDLGNCGVKTLFQLDRLCLI
jgi:hypothetical protein